MNFLAEILATAGEAEMTDLNSRVNEITEMISTLKVDVMNVMDGYYVKFRPVMEDNTEMLKRAELLNEDMTDLQTRVESQINRELANSTGKLQKLKDALQEKSLSLEVAQQLLSFHSGIIEAKRKEKSMCYVECSHKVKELKDHLVGEKYAKLLDIYVPLCNELERVYSRTAWKTLEQWKPYINWLEIDLDANKLRTEITLQISNNSNMKEQLVRALYNFELLSLEIKKFGDKLLNRVLIPVIETKTRVTVSENVEVLTVSTFSSDPSTRPEPLCQSPKLCYDVFKNLSTVFTFIHQQLDIAIDNGNRTFITELGEEISEQFCERFIKQCLDKAVPNRQEELESYGQVVEKLIEFESLLHQKGFLDDDNHRLLEYAENIDVLFDNKISQCYLQEARTIMKKDLFDVMEVGVRHEVSTERGKGETMLLTHISPNTFQFPYCQISKSAEELLNLVEKMLKESSIASSKLISKTLYHRSRQIVKMYCDIVPLHHKNLLETIPQQAAFLHNNCCYIAHRLPTLGLEYKDSLGSILSDEMITFCDLVPTLLSTGIMILRSQLNSQKKMIIDILRDSGLVTLVESTEFPTTIEKAIRQCCRQLKLLQNVWQRVLNYDTYCKAIGYLCNALVEELSHRVCSYSDIPEKTAVHLISVFNIILEKVTSVFEEPREIYKHVKQWSKFNEVIKLLGSGLKEVEERWADGKGPLAKEFTAAQIKQLIRALFTVSARRAALLARIK